MTCQEINKLVFLKFIYDFFKRLIPIWLGDAYAGTFNKIMIENHWLQSTYTIKVNLILLILKCCLYHIIHVLNTTIKNILIFEFDKVFALLGKLFIYELLFNVSDGGLSLLGDGQT